MFDDSRSPFSGPQQSSSSSVNPFTDGSIQALTPPASRLDDFNPFIEDRIRSTSHVQPVADVPSAVGSRPTSPPATTAQTSPHHVPEEVTNWQQRLEQSASNIDRQQQIDFRPPDRRDNFPPLPACCPLKPCFYQDFDVDIPARYRCTVKFGFYFWLAYVFMLLLNMVGALTLFIVQSEAGSTGFTGATFGVSIGYLFILTPASFICWYRPLYKAFRSDSSVHFFVFFFNFLWQFCVMIFACLGIGINFCSGWVGYFVGIQLLGHKQYGVGAFLMIIGALFTIMAVCNFLLISWVLKQYRNTGATFQKAQEEFSQGIKSAAVRTATTNAN